MRIACVAAALLLTPASGAEAQSLLEGWDQGQVTIYGWFPTITGSQERRDGAPLVNLDAADIIDALDFAFFGAGEIRRGRVGLAFDVEYAKLSQDGKARGAIIPGADPASASVETSQLIATGVVTYRFYDTAGRWADVYGGVRAFDIDADFKARVPSLGFRSDLSADANWVDGVVGLRGHTPLGERFAITALGDVGGFGIGSSAQLTWQVTGTLDYAFTERIAGRIGYRYMAIDYESSDLTMDVDIYGPLVGVTWTF